MTTKELAIQLKMEKAKSLLNEVDVLIEHQFYTTAISRLYYSCFHATKALMLTKDLTSKTHSGVIILLNQHFVSSGELKKDHAVFFAQLLKERIDEDYNDFMIREFSDIEPFLLPAREYFKRIEILINLFFSK